MAVRIWGLAVAALLLAANDRPPSVTTGEIRNYAKERVDSRFYPLGDIAAWETDLKQVLQTGTPDQAAASLAAKYHVQPDVMRRLVPLWVRAKTDEYAPDRTAASRRALREQLLQIAHLPDRKQLTLQIVAEALATTATSGNMGDDGCSARDFDALLQGAADRAADAWIVANSATCADNFARAMAVAPERSMPALIRQANYGGITAPRDKLPLMAWLIRPESLAHVAPADRSTVRAILTRDYAEALLDAGLSDQAIALIESLPDDIRKRALDPDRPLVHATIDAMDVTLDDGKRDAGLVFTLAAAYAVRGRAADARRITAGLPEMAEAPKLLACAQSLNIEARRPQCAPGKLQDAEVPALLTLALGPSGDDPYPVAELLFGMDGRSSFHGPWADLICQIFADASYEQQCADLRQAAREHALGDNWWEKEEARRAIAAIDALHLDDLPALRSELGAALVAYAGDVRPAPATRVRTSIDPAPVPFAERPLPAHFATRLQAQAWPKQFARLPDGHVPVRFEQKGNQVAAITLSQDLDPNGEVTPGGYWVVLSADGGRHWQPPLYTGLAANFPYVVVENSAMPMLAGDSLAIEVEVAEIDTASITYPPVGLRTRRRAKGLFLTLPLADLQRDSNDDGFTDIEARHLLLDAPATPTPDVVRLGSDDPTHRCAAQPSRDTMARIVALDRIFHVRAVPLIEQPDRKDTASFGNWKTAASSERRPLFLSGDPADFACITADRPILVYTPAGIDKLRHFSPDFRTLEMPKIIFNRARDRGFVRWSLGWTGGTLRLRWVNGTWETDVISSWIT